MEIDDAFYHRVLGAVRDEAVKEGYRKLALTLLVSETIISEIDAIGEGKE